MVKERTLFNMEGNMWGNSWMGNGGKEQCIPKTEKSNTFM